MLKLIHGENYYQDVLDLNQIRLGKEGKEVSIVDGDQVQDVGEIFINNESYGLFNSSNITIVKRFFKNPKKISLEKKIIEKLEKSDIKSLDLVFWEDTNIFASSKKKAKSKATAKKPRATSKLNTYLKNNAEVKQNDNPSTSQISEWARQKLEKENVKISSVLIQDLIARVGQNQSILSGEIDKLILWARANGSERIDKNVLENILIFYDQEYQIWDLTDAFFFRNKEKALKILDKILINPQSDFPIVIGAILRQVKIIYFVKKFSNDPHLVMSKLRLIPFIYSKANKIAQNFSLVQLKVMFQKFIDLDYSIKLGKIDVKLGLDLLIVTLS